MILYLLRHAKAQKNEPEGDDAERKLTAQGKALAFKRATKLKKKLSNVGLVVTSPYPRAAETADIFSAVLKKDDVVSRDEMLVATARPEDVLRHLRNYSRNAELLLVGHEPWLSGLVSLMISGTLQCQIRFKKLGLAVLDVEILAPRGASLQSLL
jgi:phosphohistidine phosphatase